MRAALEGITMTAYHSCPLCSDEAIGERCPAFEFPWELEADAAPEGVTLSLADAATWAEMVRRRPVLCCLRPADAAATLVGWSPGVIA